MRCIDPNSWPRREHYQVFNAFDYPHFNLCADMELASFRPFVKDHGASFTVALVYLLTRTANSLAPFRQRIRKDAVVEHDVVHPAVTIGTEEDLFSFCALDYAPDFADFAARAVERIEHIKLHPTLENEPGQDDLLYMTSIPWVSFTSLMHPIHMHPADSTPRFAWGKIRGDGARQTLPLSVQVHHALMDAVHVGRFYERVQHGLQHPEEVLGDG